MIKLNPRNPGEVFACLGLFEIAELSDTGYAGFKEEKGEVWFELRSNLSIPDLLQYIKNAQIEEVPQEEFQGDAKLEFEKGEWPRWCPVRVKFPSRSCEVVLKWWLNPLFQKEKKSVLKGWSGRETLVSLLRKLQAKIDVSRASDNFFYRVPSLSLGFDACGTWNPSMTGYSYDTIKDSALDRRGREERNPHVSPLCELLSFIALRSFRPKEIKEGGKEEIEYYLWKASLPHDVARLALIGIVDRRYLLSGWRAEVITRGKSEGYSSLSFGNPI
uniref:Uncharacterized protein n=1 Tax=Candidatus Caldatribacterium californiense TaxID=1454726 RepID=A0A7V4DFV4_9BACT